MPKNVIQHVEWCTRDAKRLQGFYQQIFDWKFKPGPGAYVLIEGVGGIFTATDRAMPLGLTPYVNVADLKKTEAKIVKAGGTVHKSRQEVPGMGWFSIFSDPDGTLIALWQAKTTPRKRAKKKKKK